MGLADAGDDEAAEERLDGAAGWTPGGCPEGEERSLEGGGEGEDRVEGGWSTDTISDVSLLKIGAPFFSSHLGGREHGDVGHCCVDTTSSMMD